MKSIRILFCCIAIFGQTYAQDVNREKAKSVLMKMSQQFAKSSFLSFDVKYRYSPEDDLSKIVDSLAGQFKIDGVNYWYALDKTEGMHNEDLNIAMFPEDSLMYIAASVAGRDNPLLRAMMFDTAFFNDPGASFDLRETNGHKIINIKFSTPGILKAIQFFVNSKTGRLTKSVSLIDERLLTGESIANSSDLISYIQMETSFSNYRNGEFDQSFFKTDRYVRKVSDSTIGGGVVRYEPSTKYRSYKIFSGNIN